MTKPTIGFVGLGAMGAPMTANLLKAGFQVSSYVNRSRTAMDELKPQGLQEVTGIQALASEVDILMCCVFDEPQNDQVLRGETGALANLKPGATIILMSTISPQYCQAIASEAKARDIAVLDCPISGLVQGAIDGTLSLMIGGENTDIERCREALEPMGTVMPCGPLGTGMLMKLANNAISIGTYSLILELRDLVGTYGMDLGTFMSILNSSTGQSRVSQTFPMRPGRLKMVGMPEKDISTCVAVAEELGLSLPVVQQILDAGRAEAKR